MNSCTPGQFQRLVAEQLSEAERETLETHLATCVPCQQALEHVFDESQGGSANDWPIQLARQLAAPAEPLEPFLQELRDKPPPSEERTTEPADDGETTEIRFPDPPTA